ncbi:hypothetical protein F2Q70_00025541 [Brassica cretica]|uniref:Uncharacterized protein n=1 Tax=Brassica cretica TaxID=69181 RepID=A0A3N6SXX7_BRACR|nr:hypothetical protein F2Q70_00025541 [Brassica cretica]KAF3583170.1 hypothetical protein DY000_02030251 [Brassica cretica]
MDKNKELGFSYRLITISQDKVSSEEPLFLIKRGSECDREEQHVSGSMLFFGTS